MPQSPRRRGGPVSLGCWRQISWPEASVLQTPQSCGGKLTGLRLRKGIPLSLWVSKKGNQRTFVSDPDIMLGTSHKAQVTVASPHDMHLAEQGPT